MKKLGLCLFMSSNSRFNWSFELAKKGKVRPNTHGLFTDNIRFKGFSSICMQATANYRGKFISVKKCDGVLVLKWRDEEIRTYICQGNCQQSLLQELLWNNWPYWKHGILISLCIFHTSNLGSGKERAQLQGNKKTPYYLSREILLIIFVEFYLLVKMTTNIYTWKHHA